MARITAPDEIAKLRHSGQIAARALQAVAKAVRPGVTTSELDGIAEKSILDQGGRPSFKGYEDFPFALCTSVNDEVVHGMPSTARRLNAGDIIGLDIGVNYQGFFSDHAITVAVGKIYDDTQRLLDDTAESLRIGLQAVKPGNRIGDIGAAIENYLAPKGYGIVTQLTGHGVGRAVHEPPTIANVGPAGAGPTIEVGMVLAIEPMVNAGVAQVETSTDGWTVITADHQPSAHFEHTVIVTADGCEIITAP